MKNAVVIAVALAVVVVGQVGDTAPKTTRKVIVALNDSTTNVTVTNESGTAPARSTRKAKAPVRVAQNQKASGKILKPKATENIPVPSTTEASEQQSPTAPTSKTGVLAPTQTVKTSAGEVKKTVKKSPFGFRYRSYNAMNLDYIEGQNPNGDGEVRAWDRFGLTYSFTDNVSLTLQPEVNHTWFGDRDRGQDDAGTEQPYSGYMGNTNLILGHSQIARLKGDIILDGSLRYDIPTSEISQRNGQLGETRVTVGLGREFGKFEVKAMLIGRSYLNQYNTSELQTKSCGDSKLKSCGKLNKEFRLYQLVDLTYNFTKRLGFTLETGFQNTTVHGDEATNRAPSRVDQIIMNPELSYAISDNFALAVGLYEEPNMTKLPDDGYVPLSVANGGEAYLQTTVKF